MTTLEVPVVEDGWECMGPGPWRHYVTVDCDGFGIDCVRLELRLTSEFNRDRPDRYRPLLDHFAAHGADLDLLRQSLTAGKVPEPFVSMTSGLRPSNEPRPQTSLSRASAAIGRRRRRSWR